ncbi:hypothetical protein Leryth_001195 [Lithospermum erythrorhizon]|nr:hypothetical protein Leryth_001195 [Lithospermum erythrorhizon]
MACMQLSVNLENRSSYESEKRLNLVVKWIPFSQFLGYVHINGGSIANPCCKLKRISVSRIDTEVSEPYESDLVNDMINDSNVALDSRENSILYENIGKGRVNIWKRFRGIKKTTKDGKSREPFRRKSEKIRKGEPGSLFGEDRVMDNRNLVDVDISCLGPVASMEQCNRVLRELERENDSKAMKFFEWMKENGKLKQNVTAYNLILRVLGRKEDWCGAAAMIKEMTAESECELSYQVFNSVIYACYKRGLVEMGSTWFRTMLESGIEPNVATFGMLMSLYQKGWIVEEAEFTFSKMRELKIACPLAYSAMITIYTRFGLYDKAEKIISFLKEDDIILNMDNWLVMLNAYCQQGKLDDGEQVLATMTEAGFSPNIVAYNTMITGYGKMSNMSTAERLFCTLEKVGLDPDETTYRSMIEGWGRVNNYKKALFYYEQLKRSGFKPNSSNLYTLINLQVKHKDEVGAINTVEDMVMIGCQMSSVLGLLLQACEKAEKFEAVPLIVKGSLHDHILTNQTSCSILVMAYVKNCLIDDALKVLKDKRWNDQIFEDNLYHLLICSCKELGHPENAVKIFNDMPKPDKPNVHITSTMIDIYSMMNLFMEAENLYKSLRTSGVSLDMIGFSIVVRMYFKSGSLMEACSVLEEMEKQNNIEPDIYLLRDMLRIYQRCDMFEKLGALYYKLQKTGISWDQELYNCVINCCARALPVDELSRIFEEMLQRGFTPSTITINVMLDVYGKSRLFKKARMVFWMAKKRGLVDVISYNTLIAAYGQNRDLKKMNSTVKQMQLNGFSISLEAFNCMLDAYGKATQMEKFREVLLKMKESGCSSDNYTYNIMINIYGEQEWIDEIGLVLMELKQTGLGPDLCSYNTLIKAYGIAGLVEEAVSLVKEMRDNGIQPDRITYRNLVTALQKNDKFLEAVRWSLWMKQVGM